MRTKLWIPLALAGVLGYAMTGDEPDASAACYTNVQVSSTIDSAGNIAVQVASGSVVLCSGLETGDVCNINVESGARLTASFNTNRSQFVYVQSSSPNVATTITSPQTFQSSLGFAVVGALGTSVYVEGDPKIQLVASSCN